MSHAAERLQYEKDVERAFDNLIALIDPLSWINAFVFLVGSLYFGTPWWKAIIIAFVVMVGTRFHYGRRLLIKGSIALMITTLAVWSEALPDLSWMVETAKTCFKPT